MKLVKFDMNWADEFDVEGFRLFTDEQWDKYCAAVVNAKDFNFMFGTNEGWGGEYSDDFTDGETLLQDAFTVYDIADIEAETIKKFFGTGGGTFPDTDAFEENQYGNN